MGIVDRFKTSSLFCKLALILLTVSLIFIYIIISTTGWAMNNTGTYYGLWRSCTDNERSANCVPLDGWALDWFQATQAMVVFGFIGINLAFFLVCLLIFTSKFGGNKEVSIGAAIICLLTGVMLMAGCIVFGVKYKDLYIDMLPLLDWKYGYDFGLAITASIIEILAGVILLIDGLKGKGTSPSA